MSQGLTEQIAAIVGSQNVFAGNDIPSRFLHDEIRSSGGMPLAVVRPASVYEISAVMKLCYLMGIHVVPQGGATGLAGGAVPLAESCVTSIVLSLERLNGIEEVDAHSATLTALAGTPLQLIQEAAADAGFFFPLDFGSRGSCQIGGNVSTNAGGNRVLRYGTTRDLVLGLEVVLPDGTVITSLNKMVKNNAGYDPRHLFIGTEGTLGIVTRVVLRLYPRTRSVCTALCATKNYGQAMALMRHMREELGGNLSAFEVMWPDFYQLTTTKVNNLRAPLPYGYGIYVLVESRGSNVEQDANFFEQALSAALEQELICDAVIAKSETEAAGLWSIRDASGEFPQIHWPHVAFDISLPTGAIGHFVEEVRAKLEQSWPESRAIFFGHLGDSNIHIAVKTDDQGSHHHEVESLIYQMVGECSGSITAEHGIGSVKREFLHYCRSQEELALMRLLKQAIDPKGILNPGKVI